MRLPVTFATCVLSLLLGAAASPVSHDTAVTRMRKREVPSTHTLHERHLPQWKKTWVKRDRLPSDYVVPLRIGIKHTDDVLQAGHDRLMELSDPAHDDYGKHMTAEEVIDFFAPDQYRVDLVIDWLVSEGFEREKIGHSVNKQWVMLDAPAERVEELLYADFHVWEHEPSGSRDIACEEYHLPTHVQEHVDYVTPGIRMRAKRSKPKFTMTPLDMETRESGDVAKRAAHMSPQPHQFEELQALPKFNSTNCDTYLRAECIRGKFTARQSNFGRR
jgi:tripeptidyl-peptidase I